MSGIDFETAALFGQARAASALTRKIAGRIGGFVDSEICNSDSWVNGVPPVLEMTLEEADEISKNLRRVADLLERIGGAA